MAIPLHTYTSGEEFRAISEAQLTVYAELSAQDWLDGYEHLRHTSLTAWHQLNDATKHMTEDEAGRGAFKERIAHAMDEKDDTVMIYDVNEAGISLHGVTRWRVYSPKIEANWHGVRRFFGRVTGVYPYMYAPDLLASGATADYALFDVLLGAAAADFADRTDKHKFMVVTDSYESNGKHQAQLVKAGFTNGNRPQQYDTPEDHAPFIGKRYPVDQFLATRST